MSSKRGWERIAWQVTKGLALIKKCMTNPDAKVMVIIRNEKVDPPSQFEAGDISAQEQAAWLRRAADTIEKDNPAFAGLALIPREKDNEQ